MSLENQVRESAVEGLKDSSRERIIKKVLKFSGNLGTTALRTYICTKYYDSPVIGASIGYLVGPSSRTLLKIFQESSDFYDDSSI